MLKFENYEVVGFEHAIRGMRHALNLIRTDDVNRPIDSEDYKMLKRFSKNPDKSRDPLLMIHLYVDITAPLYFWHELDKYRIRSIEGLPITDVLFRDKRKWSLDDFCCEKLDPVGIEELQEAIEFLNKHQQEYREGHETEDGKGWYITHRDWWQVINLLPSCYNQRRTVVLSYRELRDIYILSDYETFEDLGGWHEFRKFIDALPHSELINWDTLEEHERIREENRRMMEEKRMHAIVAEYAKDFEQAGYNREDSLAMAKLAVHVRKINPTMGRDEIVESIKYLMPPIQNKTEE